MNVRRDQIPHNFGNLGNLSLVENIMVLDPPDPLTVLSSSSVRDAIELLQQWRIGCALVVDQTGKLQGIFSERDLILKWALSDTPPEDLGVTAIMSADPVTLDSSATVAEALYLMSKGGFRHLPIVDEAGAPTGIISVKDVVDHIAMHFMRNLLT